MLHSALLWRGRSVRSLLEAGRLSGADLQVQGLRRLIYLGSHAEGEFRHDEPSVRKLYERQARARIMNAIHVGCSCCFESCYLCAKIDIEKGKLEVSGIGHGDPSIPPVVVNLSDEGLKGLYEALQAKFGGKS